MEQLEIVSRPKKGRILICSIRKWCLSAQEQENKYKYVLFGTGKHVAYRMTSLLPEPFGAGTRKNFNKRNYVLNNIQDIEYRTMSFIDNSDAKRFESYIKFAEKYLFNT